MARKQGGRERILDAALRLFGERGVEGTSMRDIATLAEVSPALVVHHFGSKAGLKDAVDAQVAGLFAELRDRALVKIPGAVGDPSGVGGVAAEFVRILPEGSPLPAYVRRMLLSGDEAGLRVFAAWFDVAKGAMSGFIEAGVARPTDDLDARLAVMVTLNAAMLALHEHIATAAGFDPTTPEGLDRWARTVFGIYAHGIFQAPAPATPDRNEPV